MASFHERLAIIVEANAGKAIAEFRKVGAAAKEAQVGVEGGAKGMARFGIAGQTASNLLKGGIAIAAAAAATAIAKFAIDGVSAFAEVAGEVRKFQRLTGATAEDASKLVSAFHVLAIDSDTAAAAVFQLTRRVESSGDKLAALGVQVARSSKTGAVDVVQTLLNVGDAYKATEDPAKRANLVFQAFGRGGAPIIPILGKTRAELEAIFAAADRHGLIFNQEQLNQAKEYGIATRELGESIKGLEIAAGEKIVPFLTELAIVITKVVDAANGDKGGFWSDLADHAKTTVFGGIIKAVVDGVHAIAGGESEASKAVAETTAAIAEQESALSDLQKSIFTATDAQRSFEAAGRTIESANRSLAKATADYNKLLAEGAVDEEKVADARRSLADATRSVGRAQREQADAQKEYDKAAAAAGILGTDTALEAKQDAADNLADANDDVTSALERQQDAQKDLDKARAGDPDYQQKLADARQGVADATQSVADATYNLGKRSYENVAAHDAEAEAIGAKADQIERLKGQLTEMLALHPEQLAFLAPILAALGGPAGTGSPLASPAPSTSPSSPLVGPIISGPLDYSKLFPGLSVGAPTSKTNNVTINTTTAVDPVHLAGQMLWALD